MEFIIQKQEEKPLVERTEVIIKVKRFEATPSNAQIQEALSKLLKRPSDIIVIRHIHQKFGKQEAIVSAYVYKSIEALEKFEPKKKEKVKKEKKEEKPAEEKKEEKPKEKTAETAEKPEKPEEKKEEPKVEEKAEKEKGGINA